MERRYEELLRTKCGRKGYQKLVELNNMKLHDFIGKYVEHCNPASIFIRTDSAEDAQYIRDKAIENGEEEKLVLEGHTVHFDGYYDQARDKDNTRLLLPSSVDLGSSINSMDRDEGLLEIHKYMKNIMEGKEAYICFFCLGPTNSRFSIPCIQITDSSYVAHSEGILYRSGYEEFKRLQGSKDYFRFVHSAGVLEKKVSKNVDKRRVYIDIEDNIVFSSNTQYGGNTIGLKKLAMRLAIRKAFQEDWLTEHMFIMGISGPGKRVTYLMGAFPSACGKTSTSMLEGEIIVGDDIAYLRKIDGKVRAVNAECGIFGIIRDVNSKDDSLIWKALHAPGEAIFSNILIRGDKTTYWLGKDGDVPARGINYSGEWSPGKKDEKGEEIPPSNKNARYTIGLRRLSNCDPRIDDPEGIEVGGMIYGGRDSDTSVPVEESFDWEHGILSKGATLESETTSATLGQEGVRTFNLMSNLDFLSIPIGKYIKSNLTFVRDVDKPPRIFSVNYFLKNKKGEYITGMKDKHIWLKWMELRIHNDVDAIKTPTGYIPRYEDLKRLFKEVLGKDYSKESYIEQFTLRISKNIEKMERIAKIYQAKVPDTPHVLFEVLAEQKERLEKLRKERGDHVSPIELV